MICMDKFKQDDNCQSSPKGKRVITAIQSSLTHKPLPQHCQINDTHLISIIKAIGFRVFHSVRQSTPLTVAWTAKHYPQAHTHTHLTGSVLQLHWFAPYYFCSQKIPSSATVTMALRSSERNDCCPMSAASGLIEPELIWGISEYSERRLW